MFNQNIRIHWRWKNEIQIQIHWLWKNEIQIHEELVSGFNFKFNPTLVVTNVAYCYGTMKPNNQKNDDRSEYTRIAPEPLLLQFSIDI